MLAACASGDISPGPCHGARTVRKSPSLRAGIDAADLRICTRIKSMARSVIQLLPLARVVEQLAPAPAGSRSAAAAGAASRPARAAAASSGKTGRAVSELLGHLQRFDRVRALMHVVDKRHVVADVRARVPSNNLTVSRLYLRESSGTAVRRALRHGRGGAAVAAPHNRRTGSGCG